MARPLPKVRPFPRTMSAQASSSACSAAALRRKPPASGQTAIDRGQFARIVIGEGDGAGEARAQAGIAVEEAAHLAGVAGDDDAEPVAMVLHQLEQGLDRLPAEIVTDTGVRGASA